MELYQEKLLVQQGSFVLKQRIRCAVWQCCRKALTEGIVLLLCLETTDAIHCIHMCSAKTFPSNSMVKYLSWLEASPMLLVPTSTV